MRPIPLLLALFLSAPAARAGELWVDVLHGDDATGDGSPAAPWKTISHAVSTAVHGDVVRVAPGVYGPSTGEALPIPLKPGVRIEGSGAKRTEVSGEGGGTLFRTQAGAGDRFEVTGLATKRADLAFDHTGAPVDATLLLKRCLVHRCDVGVRVRDDLHNYAMLAVFNSVVVDNAVAGFRALPAGDDFNGVLIWVYGSVVARNGIGFQSLGSSGAFLGLYHSILRDNGVGLTASWNTQKYGVTGNLTDVAGFVGADGNVDADPLPVDAAAFDHHLRPGSPAIDHPAPPAYWPPYIDGTFTPLTWEAAWTDIPDIDGEPRLLGAGVDAGADEAHRPSLYAWGAPRLGKSVDLRALADPFDLCLAYASAGLAPSPLFGFVDIAPPWHALASLVLDANGEAVAALAIPADPVLAGVDVYLQAARFDGVGFDGTNVDWLRLWP